MPVQDLLRIGKGFSTDVLKKQTKRSAGEERCFSVIGKERTLDLEAVSVQERDLWVLAFTHLIRLFSPQAKKPITPRRRDSGAVEEKEREQIKAEAHEEAKSQNGTLIWCLVLLFFRPFYFSFLLFFLYIANISLSLALISFYMHYIHCIFVFSPPFCLFLPPPPLTNKHSYTHTKTTNNRQWNSSPTRSPC